jgi:GMP synthase-like glutamine amidotransferase
MRLLVIQHIACEPPGAYEQEMLARGVAFDRIQIDEGQALPDWHGYQGIVAMGGPMSVNDEDKLPWLGGEKRAIAEAVRAGLPYWGVCLGAQLLAASLGAHVYRGLAPELGVYYDLALTQDASEDPVFANLPSPLTTFQWHGETFDLPAGATALAGSTAYPNQRSAGVRHTRSSFISRSPLSSPRVGLRLTATPRNCVRHTARTRQRPCRPMCAAST